MNKYYTTSSISKSFYNSSSFFIASYDTYGSSPKLLPRPKDIHDYIDDIQEVGTSEVPAAYYCLYFNE